MKKLVRILSNKFFLTGAAFAVWMIFFDQNNWSSQEERRLELKNVERNIAYLQEQISKMEEEHQQLLHNPKRLEQFAREQYKLKKDNEDLYLIE